MTLKHIATDPAYDDTPRPDYDYTLKFNSNTGTADTAAITDDPLGMLGIHDESNPFFAAGKDATLFVAWVTSETVATLPTDRKRVKLGVGEEVNLTIKPASLPTVTWQVTGTAGTSAVNNPTGTTTKLTAGERACTPFAEATTAGKTLGISFNVIEPSGISMEQEQGTGTWHIQEKPSAGFKGRALIEPFDVSFIKIEIREGQCAGTGIGYYAYQNGAVHPDGGWGGIIPGTAQKPSKDSIVDTIRSGADGAATPAVGSFDWPIPWLFRVSGGGEKQFTTVTHHHESDAAGRVTISKGGVSVSANISDPTTP